MYIQISKLKRDAGEQQSFKYKERDKSRKIILFECHFRYVQSYDKQVHTVT